MSEEGTRLRCSVTIMPILRNKIGFLRRDAEDSYAGLLTAPGGSLTSKDGDLIDGVNYYSVEKAAIREMWEKTGIRIIASSLKYFCSMTLPSMRIVLSFYCRVSYTQVIRGLGYLEFYDLNEVSNRDDFAPGMKQESLQLFDFLGKGG